MNFKNLRQIENKTKYLKENTLKKQISNYFLNNQKKKKRFYLKKILINNQARKKSNQNANFFFFVSWIQSWKFVRSKKLVGQRGSFWGEDLERNLKYLRV